MAKFLGEGTVTAGGQTWRLRFDMNVLAELEDRFPGKSAMEILEELDADKPAIKVVREVCHAMLHRHHPEAEKAVAGDILSEDMDGLMAVIQAAMPQPVAGSPAGNGSAATVN